MRLRLLLAACILLLAACSDPAGEKFETARFEEQQFNREHAVQLYREILAEHPDSPFARRAEERLKDLGVALNP